MFAVQYHPEAAPGPHDAFPHFDEFLASLRPAATPKAKPLTDNT
jgi:carbamoylphosphate synthase small subunit